MSVRGLTPADVIAIKAKYPDEQLMKIDITRVNKVEKRGNTTYYIPITFMNLDGRFNTLFFNFKKQLLGSNPKLPYGKEEDEATSLTISYRNINEEMLKKTSYKGKDYEALIKSNKEFLRALDIIVEEFNKTVQNDIYTNSSRFKLTSKTKEIRNFRQTHRLAKDDEQADDDGKIPLDSAIYRFKLDADPETKEIGIKRKDKFIHNVYDLRKSAEKNEKVPATILVNGKPTNLNVTNAKTFITYMSSTEGSLKFDTICVSSMGISMPVKFNVLYVLHHKSIMGEFLDEQSRLDALELNDDVEEVSITIDEPKKKKPTKKDSDDESEPQSDDSLAEKKKKKANKKVIISDDDE